MKIYKLLKLVLVLLIISILNACISDNNKKTTQSSEYIKGTFGDDFEFLKKWDNVILLADKDSAGMLVVSSKYQGKVFTSTTKGMTGHSFGWINYDAFSAPLDPHMNAYGGEDRLWLGPEGGPFSVFFPKGKPMEFENWKTPAAIDSEPWIVKSKNGNSVVLQKDFPLNNYAGNDFHIMLEREIILLDENSIESIVRLPVNNLNFVGFQTKNTLTNVGPDSWTKETGTVCLWSLDMFIPSEETVVIIPFQQNVDGKVATTDYFGEIPEDRIHFGDSVLFFKADGKERGKLGLSPLRAGNFAASYDPNIPLLTITVFRPDTSKVYMNQEWSLEKDPWKGDAVNSYNDGPLEDGGQLGPFYELESVSPAAFLTTGGNLKHFHTVLHFTGEVLELNNISVKVLGVSLEEITEVF